MKDSNLLGLILATLVAPEIHEIGEELRGILEEVGPKITALVVAFLAEGASPQSTFTLEVELDRRLKLIGQRMLETVFNRLEPEDPESLPSNSPTNSRNTVGNKRKPTTAAHRQPVWDNPPASFFLRAPSGSA